VTLTPDGNAYPAGPAPYLDAQPPEHDIGETVKTVLQQPWLAAGVEQLATAWAVNHDQPQHLAAVQDRVSGVLDRTASEVRRRLTMQINYLDGEAGRLRADLEAGKRSRSKTRQSPERLEARARALEVRLAERLTTITAEGQLAAKHPTLAGAALILPAGLIKPGDGPRGAAIDTTIVERRAVDAVLAAEAALGRRSTEMPHNNPGPQIHGEVPAP
jgi:hypothetical protein